ncbi:hypothetical protein [Roseateles sp. LYH14W]|uniref:Uncharacterized protein n=1 Tax=Pelomonas parva TaxID=3299032 RepID=A0ABW7FBB2_9BURK
MSLEIRCARQKQPDPAQQCATGMRLYSQTGQMLQAPVTVDDSDRQTHLTFSAPYPIKAAIDRNLGSTRAYD